MKLMLHAMVAGLALLVGAAQAAEAESAAGFQFFQVEDPVSAKPMRAVLFYPAEAEAGHTKVGPVDVAAKESVPVKAGR